MSMATLDQIAATRVMEMELRGVVRVKPETTLAEVVAAMVGAKRGAVLVEDPEGRLQGIFTERDLMMRVDHGDIRWREWPVSEVMTRQPAVLGIEGSIGEALRSMASGRWRHIPVVDADGRAQALVSIRDILEHFADRFPQEFLNLPPDPRHEASARWGG
jgi:CBS domain-containing protein